MVRVRQRGNGLPRFWFQEEKCFYFLLEPGLEVTGLWAGPKLQT